MKETAEIVKKKKEGDRGGAIKKNKMNKQVQRVSHRAELILVQHKRRVSFPLFSFLLNPLIFRLEISWEICWIVVGRKSVLRNSVETGESTVVPVFTGKKTK